MNPESSRLAQAPAAAPSAPAAPAAQARQADIRRYMLGTPMPRRIRIAILDDHPVIALGMASFLQHQADFDIVHTHTSSNRFFETLKDLPCDVAIVDFYLPEQPADGVNFIKRLRRTHPGMVVITYSGGKIADTEYAAFRAGANGYAPKGERLPVLADLIRLTVSNPHGFYTCQGGVVRECRPLHPEERLTDAELEILRNIALGLSVTQIAAKLLRSKKTVSTHKRRAMTKLGLADDLALALYLKEKFERQGAG